MISQQLHNLKVFFSNRLEVLYQQLKVDLFGREHPPLARRMVVVYGPAMKNWVTLRMAKDPDLNIAMGIEFVYLNQAFETLLKKFSKFSCHIPSKLELALAIEKEIKGFLENFEDLTIEEQQGWDPILKYLKLETHPFTKIVFFTKKMEKRITGISIELARLFQDYGRYAYKMIQEWELTKCMDWQAQLWRRLFHTQSGWAYFSEALSETVYPSCFINLYFFSISFLTAREFHYLQKLSSLIPVFTYLLSPCAVFWSDIRSDRENAFLQKYLQKTIHKNTKSLSQLEEFLRDRNPLLANFGRLGREMASLFDESMVMTEAHYVLSEKTSEINEEAFFYNDLYFEPTASPLSLLQALQADLLLMRNPQGFPAFNFENEDDSIQIHISPGKRREVQILYHNILNIIKKDSTIEALDVIVMAPDIQEYAPYIHSVFGDESCLLDYQILDLGIHTQSEIVQGFLQLLRLSESRWDNGALLQLLEHPSFRRRHQLTPNDFALIKEWIEETGILWGDNSKHRNELLLKSYCEKKMVDETNQGTWDYGWTQLVAGLAAHYSSDTSEIIPFSSIEFSQAELLGKWIRIFHSLRDDLIPLQDRTKMSINDWSNYLICLLDHYLQPDYENAALMEDYRKIKKQFEILSSSSVFKDALYPFSTIKKHLTSLLEHQGAIFQEDHIQSIRFCSLMPMRSIPAKVISLLGMHEGAFPRLCDASSLNRMSGYKNADYCPLSTDYDRYLFLEVLHSARNHLLISYQGYNQKDGQTLQPSLVIDELLSYLDKSFTICGEKISKKCIYAHPFDSFDKVYFTKGSRFFNFSHHDYRAAKVLLDVEKSKAFSFLNDFSYFSHHPKEIFLSGTQLELKFLEAAARNPIKFHLQKVMDIYLQDKSKRTLLSEEQLTISKLDNHHYKLNALKETLEAIKNKAVKEGKLPIGLFKTVAERRLEEEVCRLHANMHKYGVQPKEVFQIEFNQSCSSPFQFDKNRWVFPPCFLEFEENYRLCITGKIMHASPQGLLALAKGSIGDVWKIWPQFLLYCHAAKLKPDLLRPQLIMVEAGKSYPAFFECPHESLKQFIHYYTSCINCFSPLMPEWIHLILAKDSNSLKGKMRQLFEESFGVYQSEEARWIINLKSLPCCESLIHKWNETAKKLLGGIALNWFPSKREAE